jgi:predicted Zn-dependent protease
VLKNLYATLKYGVEFLAEDQGVIERPSFRMDGSETTLEEMIESTQRGLIVTRFSNTDMLYPDGLLATGVTRDGLWLVEKGKITKAVANMRFTESPLFVLNQIEQIGPAVPVFRPETKWQTVGIRPAIVPPIKARDFSFTSTVDAI